MSGTIDAGWLAAAAGGGLWRRIETVEATGSTNADLAAAARAGEPGGRVLVADYQGSGRGRFDRAWVAPPGAAVGMSVLVRPGDDWKRLVGDDGSAGGERASGGLSRTPRDGESGGGRVGVDDPARWLWLPLVTGLAVAGALRESAGADARVKWPNDVFVGGRKICGILCERVESAAGPAAVIGMGVNTAMTREELPVPTATSLAAEGLPSEPGPVVAAILRHLEGWYGRWLAGENLAGPYADACDTIGRDVRVIVSDTETVEGRACGVDASGCLLVETDGGVRPFAAGDVVHVR